MCVVLGFQSQTQSAGYFSLVAHVSYTSGSIDKRVQLLHLLELVPTHSCMTIGAVAIGTYVGE